MKNRFWMLPAVALFVSPSMSPLASAQDETKSPKVETVVISEHGTSEEEVEKKIKEALEKAGVADEIKERVMKDMARSKEAIKKQTEKLQDQAKSFRDQMKTFSFRFDQDDVGEDFAKGLNARVLRMMGDQKYRIGVQTSVWAKEDGDTDTASGLIIENVFPDSPADKSGIKVEDVLVKVNGEKLESVEQLTKAIQAAGKDGKEVEIELQRGEDTKTLKVKPSEIKDIDSVVENIQLPPQAGWVVGPGREPNFKIGGAFDFSEISDLKKEIEGLRADIKEIKEMLKDIKK